MRRLLALGALLVLGAATSEAQAARALLRRLGRPDTARLVIIHADDAGMSPGADRATLRALAAGHVSSASFVTVGESVADFVAALRPGDRFDLGLHLALTSETPAMRFVPAAGAASVPSLVDADGTLHLRTPPAPDTLELERELTAQLTRARALGVRLTHLDSHQGALLFHGRERFAVLRRVARRDCLAIPVPETFFGRFPYLADALADGQPALADLVSIDPSVPPERWEAAYAQLFDWMRPGVTLLLVHLGDAGAEERRRYRDHVEYDAAWRARDAALVDADALRAMARARNIEVISWRELREAAALCP